MIPQKLLAIAAVVSLAACGSAKQSTSAETGTKDAGSTQSVPGFKYSLADGPGICIAKVKEKLGGSTQISEIDAHFGKGTDIDPDFSEPKGALQICTASYQDPSDPKKLVRIRMNAATGEFGEPEPIEVTVMGDPDTFKLSDHLMPLGNVDPSSIAPYYAAKSATLSKRFSKYTIGMVRLMPPDEFHDKFAFRIDVDGRLASNDIKSDGFVTFSLDGKQTFTDALTKS